MTEEQARIAQSRDRLSRALGERLHREQAGLDALRSRPAIADPVRALTTRVAEVGSLHERVRRSALHLLDREAVHLEHTRARVRALSPAATLDRGYAVVQRVDGHVVRAPADAPDGTRLRLRVAGGELGAVARTPPPAPIG